MARVDVQRIYDEGDGGHRVLVDRLWPRGVKKGEAGVDAWLKDVAPSTELRRWYGHQVDRFDEFVQRYRQELSEPPAADAVDGLRRQARRGRLVLVTATKDVEHSAARVLRDVLTEGEPPTG